MNDDDFLLNMDIRISALEFETANLRNKSKTFPLRNKKTGTPPKDDRMAQYSAVATLLGGNLVRNRGRECIIHQRVRTRSMTLARLPCMDQRVGSAAAVLQPMASLTDNRPTARNMP